MSLKFGTSGVRGLVSEMTDRECCLYTRAFLRYLKQETDSRTIVLAGDLRPSTPRILEAVAFAARREAVEVDFCGTIPTPALTLYGMNREHAGIMVTGSHVPADRNGIKFNMPWGEVSKVDEKKISRLYDQLRESSGEKHADRSIFDAGGKLDPSLVCPPESVNNAPRRNYLRRYLDSFPEQCLTGLKVVCHQHSSVSRDLIPEILAGLGAKTETVGRSDQFIPVDTEAVSNPGELADWVSEFQADALVTADGDGDRPLVVDEQGQVIRGDILGILVSAYLKAESVSVPVSCNTALEKCAKFENVRRTKIGSPFVIESMRQAVAAGYSRVVGYEANGGFLTATDVSVHGCIPLEALPTRDAMLPILAVLEMAGKRNCPLSRLVAEMPSRFTQSGLLRGVSRKRGRALVSRFVREKEHAVQAVFGSDLGTVSALDFTDGARITFDSGEIVHLRPSGNAPEFRCYTEADSVSQADKLNEIALEKLAGMLGEP